MSSRLLGKADSNKEGKENHIYLHKFYYMIQFTISDIYLLVYLVRYSFLQN